MNSSQSPLSVIQVVSFHVPGAHAAIVVPDEHKAAFAQLIQRGSNLWPDAPPAIKEFADLVTTGKVLQKYEEQNKDQRKPATKLPPDPGVYNTNTGHYDIVPLNNTQFEDDQRKY